MMAAFMFWQVHIAWGVPIVPAIILVVFVIGPLFGALIERVIMRGIEGTSDVVKIVVTISLMVALIGIANVIWDPNVGRPVPPFFDGKTTEIVGVVVTYQRLMTLGVAIVVAAALALMFRFTRLGIAMRAVVDDRSLMMLNGGRPGASLDDVVALGRAWRRSPGVLLAPEQTLSATTLTLIFINSYAVAVVVGPPAQPAGCVPGRCHPRPRTVLCDRLPGPVDHHRSDQPPCGHPGPAADHVVRGHGAPAAGPAHRQGHRPPLRALSTADVEVRGDQRRRVRPGGGSARVADLGAEPQPVAHGLLHRGRHALPRAVDGLRRSDLARPAHLHRHRRGRDGGMGAPTASRGRCSCPSGCARSWVRWSPSRRCGSRASTWRWPMRRSPCSARPWCSTRPV
ncbi:MAG: branched-chain amino acid ABC transporter permease [Actinobacteria bacterium]|nr:branched-chain amino acid ABC transporter permease [Actinomycetota bacterium]